MGKINILDDRTINQIAAGEVVENPASVIKELVENSIDAGSTAITVEFEKGGTELIRITDNGSGMEADDARTAFIRHATSKVKNPEDLMSIATMGFRGEALASISEVASVELTTSMGNIGTRIRVKGGAYEDEREIGYPRGTSIEVTNLFFNTPARKKFLKSVRSETNNVLELCAKFILAHPDISFKVINNGRTEMRSDGTGDALSAIKAVYGIQSEAELASVQYAFDGIEITGYTCKPVYAQLNRRKQSFFVNGRFVKCALVSAALDEAYKGKLMINKFPYAVLYIKLPYGEVDVNVHPQKTEVRFSNTKAVYAAVVTAVTKALQPKDVLPEVKLVEEEPVNIVRAPDVKIEISDRFDEPEATPVKPVERIKDIEAFDASAVISMPAEKTVKPAEKPIAEPAKRPEFKAPEPIIKPKDKFEQKAEPQKAYSESLEQRESEKLEVNNIGPAFSLREDEIRPEKAKPEQLPLTYEVEETAVFEPEIEYKVSGVLWDTYILVEVGDTCYMIDQHAAHERLLYDKYSEEFKNRKVAVQQLLIPEIIETEPTVVDIISENVDSFAEVGFDIEVFGKNSCIIRGVPSVACNASFNAVFDEALELLKQNSSIKNVVTDIVCPEIMKSACKHAVKGNQKLSDAEVKYIVKSLSTLKGLTCPHGRPIAITMTKKETEKIFGRIQ